MSDGVSTYRDFLFRGFFSVHKQKYSENAVSSTETHKMPDMTYNKQAGSIERFFNETKNNALRPGIHNWVID